MRSIAPDPPDAVQELHVVAAVIEDDHARLLISRRPDHVHLGGLWEFPGGKVEDGEDIQSALARELREELGIAVREIAPLITVRHVYPEKRVRLEIWRVTNYQGRPSGCEGQQIAWVAPDELHSYDFPDADLPVLKALRLPSRYVITPEPTVRRGHFLNRCEQLLQAGHDLIQLRAKTLETREYLSLARQLAALCRAYGARLTINGDPQWVPLVGAHGVHLTQDRLRRARGRVLPKDFVVGASCHSAQDLQHAERIDADFAVLSPVRATLTHPGATSMGWRYFTELVDQARLPIYALGGMNENDLARARQCGAQGIAGIRCFWPQD